MNTKTQIDDLFIRVEVASDNLATFLKILSVLKRYQFNPEMTKNFELAIAGNELSNEDNSSYSEADILKAKPIINDMCSIIEQKLYPTQLGFQAEEIAKKNARMVVDEKNHFLRDFSTLFLVLEDECIERRNELEHVSEEEQSKNFDYNSRGGEKSNSLKKEMDIAKKVKSQFFENLRNTLNEGFKAIHVAEAVLKNPMATLNEKKTAVSKVHECDQLIGNMLVGAQHTLSMNVMTALNKQESGKDYKYDFCNELAHYVMANVKTLSDVEEYGKQSGQLYKNFNQHYSDNLDQNLDDLDQAEDFYDQTLDSDSKEHEYDEDYEDLYGLTQRI